MTGRDECHVQDGEVVVVLRLKPHEAQGLSAALLSAVDREGIGGRQAERWKGLAGQLRRAAKELRPYKQPGRVRRPPASYRSEIDRLHVLHGGPPYPVLSVPDMRTVYPELERRKLSAQQIAQRLHVAARSVNCWRKKRREEGEGEE